MTKKNKERIDRLLALGLIFNGQDFIYKDVNINWMEALFDTDKEFEQRFQGVEGRMKVLKSEEKSDIPEEECDKCGESKSIIDFEIIRPKNPADAEQCHPFMEMEYICKECYNGE